MTLAVVIILNLMKFIIVNQLKLLEEIIKLKLLMTGLKVFI